MAAETMENDGTYRAVETSRKSDASRAGSASLMKLREFDANPRGVNEKFSRADSVSSKFCYAGSLLCNKHELSPEIKPRQTVFVSFLKQQLLRRAEVLLQAFAIHSELTPVTFPKKARATAAVPRVTEFRRERCHPAGRQRRPHESRAPRRAGSQG
ncbi:hypothetical protein IB256_13625 [Pseudomonas sp. PDM17]|uniref:hypothetical protein n=1 Tax=Pseudomonas sp. PDM17 TaxID=2769285 RepID=UPI0017834FAA|nr:hypothetical protein [Pseudomonas sp. PDM17]MBD9501822.1 hypothetical protein [Pseudomonas sp. PDM17]